MNWENYTGRRNSMGWPMPEPKVRADGVVNEPAFNRANQLKKERAFTNDSDPRHAEVVKEVNWNMHRAYGEEGKYKDTHVQKDSGVGPVEQGILADAKKVMSHPAY